MTPETTSETSIASRKKRLPRVAIGAAAVKLVESLFAGNRYAAGIRSAEVLALALERDGDMASAENIRAAAAHGGQMESFTINRAGNWRGPGEALDEIILSPEKEDQFARLITELEAAPRFLAAGIDAPTRIFFEGASGTGKTLAAQHLAARLGLQLLTGRLDQVVDSHMGESAKKIASLFESTRGVPCVLFIDEIDGIVGDRGKKSGAAELEAARTTSSLLQQLDSLPMEQIVVVASNFPGEMDEALYRRFPTRITFDTPTFEARRKMLRYWWRNLSLCDDRSGPVAATTHGLSGAELRALAMSIARDFILSMESR